MKKRVLTMVVALMLTVPLSANATEEPKKLPESFYLYDEAGEAAKRAVDYIHQTINCVEKWDAITLSGLYIRLKEEILKAVNEDGENTGYQIVEIQKYDKQYFSIKVEPKSTVYTVKKGDTLSKIARKYKTTVDMILELNPQIENKDLIFEGQSLTVK